MEAYKKELSSIKVTLKNYYAVKFLDHKEAYETNQRNKEKIGQLLISIKQAQDLSESERKNLINETLMLLAKNTGSAEDSEIAERLLDHLFFELKVINQNEIDQFYQFSSTRRWE